MAWNFEKGCEEERPYNNMLGSVHSPPMWGKAWSAVQVWTQAEAWVDRSKWGWAETKDNFNQQAILRWIQCEREIMWDKNSEIPEFRRKYIDWLAREKNVSSEIGLTDVDIESMPLLERVIAAGYKQLAKTAHPDLGGSQQEFLDLRNARTQLDRMLAEVGEILKEGS